MSSSPVVPLVWLSPLSAFAVCTFLALFFRRHHISPYLQRWGVFPFYVLPVVGSLMVVVVDSPPTLVAVPL